MRFAAEGKSCFNEKVGNGSTSVFLISNYFEMWPLNISSNVFQPTKVSKMYLSGPFKTLMAPFWTLTKEIPL